MKEFTILEKDLIHFKKRRYVRSMTEKAIRQGHLIRPKSCECCRSETGDIDAHHVDYGKPYEVMWLCSVCHGKAHRKNSALNPKNNPQTPLPHAVEKYESITISYNVPVRTFLAIKSEAEKRGVTMSKMLRDHVEKTFPTQKNQFEFKIIEETYDITQSKQHSGIQGISKDAGLLPKRQRARLQKIRSEGDNSLQRVEGKLHPIFIRHGKNANGMQRNCVDR